MKLDTSTEVNIMPDQVYQKLVTNENVSKDAEIKTNTKLMGYGGTEIPVTRRCTLLCLYKEQEIETEFYVVETNNRAVLSLETCKELNLIKVMHSLMSSNKVSDCSTEQIKENFRDFSWSWKTRQVLSYENGSTSSSYWVSPRKIPATNKAKGRARSYGKGKVIVKVEEPTHWVHNHVII